MELLWTLYYESNYSINQTFLYSHNIIWIDNSFFVKFDGSWKDAKKWKKNDNKAWFIKYRISQNNNTVLFVHVAQILSAQHKTWYTIAPVK